MFTLPAALKFSARSAFELFLPLCPQRPRIICIFIMRILSVGASKKPHLHSPRQSSADQYPSCHCQNKSGDIINGARSFTVQICKISSHFAIYLSFSLSLSPEIFISTQFVVSLLKTRKEFKFSFKMSGIYFENCLNLIDFSPTRLFFTHTLKHDR